ncbi:MAG: hypothetical protein COA52_00840 [Hyphomicrobiales bacterium]|nr:MAG: hypothetical protein COA52_00840 [Hyphomicrobiales bacterium]
MDNFKQYLEEGRDAPLFHGTSIRNAAKILKMNTMTAQTRHKQFPPAMDTPKNVISLTRSFKFAKRWYNHVHYRGVIFELDQRKLAQRHKIMVYNHFGLGDYGGKGVAREKNDVRANGFPINQYEENIIGDIKNLDKFLIKIHVTTEFLSYKYFDEELLKHPLLWNIDTKKWVNK